MNAYATAARRLRLAANVFEARAHHRSPALLDIVTRGFRSAAGAFEDTAPAEPGELPEELADAVAALAMVFRAHDFHLSAALVAYAVEPVTGVTPPMKVLGAVSEKLARDDFDLQKRRNTVLHHPHLESADDEVTSWALRALATVHYKHERLAAEVAADNARLCHEGRTAFHLLPAQRQHTGRRSA
ncbi:hypothetical protein ABZ923_40135 [Streptomyces sp. NPDC046881]|uniref:hypothetical protein n=1 Tax=Streptomyces sp. NPDC046881 TaxID=3155374 RepID=UPI0033C7A7E7